MCKVEGRSRCYRACRLASEGALLGKEASVKGKRLFKRTGLALQDAGEDLSKLRGEERGVGEAVGQDEAERALKAVVREDAGVEVAAQDGLARGVAEDLGADLRPERIVVVLRARAGSRGWEKGDQRERQGGTRRGGRKDTHCTQKWQTEGLLWA